MGLWREKRNLDDPALIGSILVVEHIGTFVASTMLRVVENRGIDQCFLRKTRRDRGGKSRTYRVLVVTQ